jgi:protein gp37
MKKSLTKIEWTQRTWNPVRGCDKVSAGCKHCYAETFAERWRGVPGHPYEQGFDLKLVPHKLTEPLSWREPGRVFVNSMSDLFHEDIPSEYIAAVFGIMAACPHLTFQVLTKRALEMLGWFQWMEGIFGTSSDGKPVKMAADPITTIEICASRYVNLLGKPRAKQWPLPNVELLVSAENSEKAGERIPLLLRTPAAVRGVSIEPMLEGFELDADWIYPRCTHCGRHYTRGSSCVKEYANAATDGCPDGKQMQPALLDWIICGGESGPGARPFYIEGARALVHQCRDAQLPIFVKQLGDRAMTEDTGDWPLGSRLHVGKTMADLRWAQLRSKGGDMTQWPEELRVRMFAGERYHTTVEVGHA